MLDLKLHALSQPRRREILRLIRDRELSSGEIAGHFEVTRPAVSQHLQVLAQAGLIDLRRKGTSRLYRARPTGLNEVRAYLETFWEERLGDLKQVAEEEYGRAEDGKRD
jgi:DNA-binding transcriptional ArsR family regulator